MFFWVASNIELSKDKHVQYCSLLCWEKPALFPASHAWRLLYLPMHQYRHKSVSAALAAIFTRVFAAPPKSLRYTYSTLWSKWTSNATANALEDIGRFMSKMHQLCQTYQRFARICAYLTQLYSHHVHTGFQGFNKQHHKAKSEGFVSSPDRRDVCWAGTATVEPSLQRYEIEIFGCARMWWRWALKIWKFTDDLGIWERPVLPVCLLDYLAYLLGQYSLPKLGYAHLQGKYPGIGSSDKSQCCSGVAE